MEFEDKTQVLKTASIPQRGERRSACLVVISGSELGRIYKLDEPEIVLGRGDTVGIRIVDDGVSRRHAKLIQKGDAVTLLDLDSTNGTFCNGERVDERVLRDGDKIRIGTTTILKFSMQDALEEDFSRRQYEWATRDSLTGCFNKKYFVERLPAEIAYAKRHDKALSLAMCDIDHFKRINDTYGHTAGDVVLRNVARALLESVRQEDTVSRWGGEEFAVVMRDTKGDAAFVAAERIRRRLELMPIEYDGKQIIVTISIGIASWGEVEAVSTPEAFVDRADAYLYRAKHEGRNRTESMARGDLG
ncbi:MAG: diguanylate cyclase [Myxococcota bacterium]|nr:GGDEF domain-containing protein [Myxococcota bacterium]